VKVGGYLNCQSLIDDRDADMDAAAFNIRALNDR